MKGILTLTIWTLLAMPTVFANGESLSIREKARGSAGVDEGYTKALQRETRAREKMESNPRNPAMVESFEGVSSDKEKQREEEKEKLKKKKSGDH